MSSQQSFPQQGCMPDPVRGTVVKVFGNYAIAYPEVDWGDLTRNDSVTFSLSDWQGVSDVEQGQVVELLDTALYSRGWRAKHARPLVPSKQKTRRV